MFDLAPVGEAHRWLLSFLLGSGSLGSFSHASSAALLAGWRWPWVLVSGCGVAGGGQNCCEEGNKLQEEGKTDGG